MQFLFTEMGERGSRSVAGREAWARGGTGVAVGSILWKRISAVTGGPGKGEKGGPRFLDPPSPRFVLGG